MRQTVRRRDDAIEADANYSLAGPGMRDALPEVDAQFDQQLADMMRAAKTDQNRLVPQTPPLNRLSPGQRQRFYNAVQFMTEVIGQNIQRPEDPEQLAELRRREAAAHSSSSSAGVQLYKPGEANLRYATQRPANWSEVAGRNYVTAEARLLGEAAVGPHQHSLDDTLLLDIRMAMQKPDSVTTEPLPAMVQAPHFPYFMLAADDRRNLQLLSQHAAFINYANKLSRGGAATTIAAAVENARRETGLALVCVLFRYDIHSVELVLQINSEASFFGVLAYSTADGTNTAELRPYVIADLDAAYRRDVAAATAPDPTLRRADHQLPPTITSEYYKAHDLCTRGGGTSCERLVARASPMRVSAPEKSELLGRVQVQYRYGVFLSCQCLMSDEDLAAFRRRIDQLAREQRSVRVARGAERRAAAELLPLFEADAAIDTKRPEKN